MWVDVEGENGKGYCFEVESLSCAQTPDMRLWLRCDCECGVREAGIVIALKCWLAVWLSFMAYQLL